MPEFDATVARLRTLALVLAAVTVGVAGLYLLVFLSLGGLDLRPALARLDRVVGAVAAGGEAQSTEEEVFAELGIIMRKTVDSVRDADLVIVLHGGGPIELSGPLVGAPRSVASVNELSQLATSFSAGRTFVILRAGRGQQSMVTEPSPEVLELQEDIRAVLLARGLRSAVDQSLSHPPRLD